MEKEKIKTHTTGIGILNYPYLVKPDTKFNADGLYHCKLVLSKEDGEPMVKEIENSLASLKTKKLSSFKPYKKVENGYEFSFKLKAKVATKSGAMYEQKPKLFDSKGQIMANKEMTVWGGSKGKVAFQIYTYENNMLGSGVTLKLRAVQITELVEGKSKDNSESYGFSSEDGYEVIIPKEMPVVHSTTVAVTEDKFDF
jgi:hypothetical protein